MYIDEKRHTLRNRASTHLKQTTAPCRNVRPFIRPSSTYALLLRNRRRFAMLCRAKHASSQAACGTTVVAGCVACDGSVMRDFIISEIKRLAAQAGGQAPGNQAFVSATGIIESTWRGKYWARWGDALIEAGFEPNIWTGKSDAKTVSLGIVAAARQYGHFPTTAEISMLRSSDASIPAPKTIQANLGGRSERVDAGPGWSCPVWWCRSGG
jgi:hypothetical protein